MSILNAADALMLGSTPVDAVYAGAVQVWPSAGPPPGLTLTWRAAGEPTNPDGNAYWNGVSIGAASATRTVIVAVASWSAGNRSVSAVTIGGVSATIDASASNVATAIARAVVPTGTTADILITTTDGTVNMSASVWTVNGLITPASTDSPNRFGSGITSMAASLSTTVDGGFAVVAHRSRSNAFSTTWTNATERYDTEAAQPYSGADAATTGSALTITATPSITTTSTSGIIAAAYGPA